MPGHRWSRPICSAWAKSRGRPCQRRVGLRPDGTLHTVCNNHGALTPPYSERPISEAGKQRISAAAKAMWKRYHALKAAGLPAWQVGRKKLPAKPPKPKARPTPKPQQRMTDSEWLAAIRQDPCGAISAVAGFVTLTSDSANSVRATVSTNAIWTSSRKQTDDVTRRHYVGL